MRFAEDDQIAGRFVDEAFAEIRDYRRTKHRECLVSAAAQIGRARAEAPAFLPALYGEAVIDDLEGRAVDAIPRLQKVLALDPPFRDEVEYRLGVALYHRFNHESLDRAIEHLKAVVGRTTDRLLECQARVALLQAYGMRMVPRD